MKKTPVPDLLSLLFFLSLFIFFLKFSYQKNQVLAQTCQDGDGICPEGCTPENDNDCVDFSSFSELGPTLTRGGDLEYYYLWRYREEVYGSGRGHYINQCDCGGSPCRGGGDYQGQTTIRCFDGSEPVAVTEMPGAIPPTDEIDAHSFTRGGDEIMIGGDKYWKRNSEEGTWREGDLADFWKTLPNGTPTNNWDIVPTSDIDAFAVEPESCGGYGITQGSKGWWVCSDGNWHEISSLADIWTSGVHPPHSGIGAMEYLNVGISHPEECDGDGIIKVYYKGDKVWIQCNINDSSVNMTEQTLIERWENQDKLLVKPPVSTGVDTYGIDPSNPSNEFHFTSSSDRYWIADNDAWHSHSFESGPDSWLLREVDVIDNTAKDGKYYLFYDAMTLDSNEYRHRWQSALAVSGSPVGPWQKRGFIGYSGEPRWWESGNRWGRGGSCSTSVTYSNDHYYLFYFGHNTVVEPDTWAVPGWWGRGSGVNQDPNQPASYHLGLAVADSIYGPWTRVDVEGVNNEDPACNGDLDCDGVDCSTDGCVISQSYNGNFGDEYAANKGTLILKNHSGNPTCDCDTESNCNSAPNLANINCAHLFVYTGTGTNWNEDYCGHNTCWGHGIIYTEADDFSGPWYRINLGGTDVIVGPKSDPLDFGSENNDLYYEESSQTWFLFSDSKYYPGGWGSCGSRLGGGKGQIIHWTKDLFNWPESNFHRINSPDLGRMSCNPVDNSLRDYLRKNPEELTSHRGNDGMVSVLQVGNKLYVYYDGNDFTTTHEDIFDGTIYEGTENSSNHMFRDIWVATLDLPLSQVKGDLNGDKVVDTQDFKILLANWSSSPEIPRADLNSDSIVNGMDFGEMVKLIQ